MKDLETFTRKEPREPTEPDFSTTASENSRPVHESEPDSRNPFSDIIGREAYRLSPLSEW